MSSKYYVEVCHLQLQSLYLRLKYIFLCKLLFTVSGWKQRLVYCKYSIFIYWAEVQQQSLLDRKKKYVNTSSSVYTVAFNVLWAALYTCFTRLYYLQIIGDTLSLLIEYTLQVCLCASVVIDSSRLQKLCKSKFCFPFKHQKAFSNRSSTNVYARMF